VMAGIETTATVRSVKVYIQEQKGVPEHRQKLVHGKTVLKDSIRLLRSYGVPNNAELNLIVLPDPDCEGESDPEYDAFPPRSWPRSAIDKARRVDVLIRDNINNTTHAAAVSVSKLPPRFTLARLKTHLEFLYGHPAVHQVFFGKDDSFVYADSDAGVVLVNVDPAVRVEPLAWVEGEKEKIQRKMENEEPLDAEDKRILTASCHSLIEALNNTCGEDIPIEQYAEMQIAHFIAEGWSYYMALKIMEVMAKAQSEANEGTDNEGD
jgi:hypothetical protein